MHNHSYLDFTSPQQKNNEELSQDLFYDDNEKVNYDPVEDAIEDKINADFYHNLISDYEMGSFDYIGSNLRNKIDQDRTSRQYKDERYAKMLKRLGFTENDMIGGADFPGASKVVHPVIAEGVIDFASRAIKEILPPNGPVKTKIIGKENTEKIERANRKREFLNWQLTDKIDYRNKLEKLLTQLCLAGSAFIKLHWDNYYKELCIDFVPIDHLFLPYHCEDFAKSDRITHIIKMDEEQFKAKVREGVYHCDLQSFYFESAAEENLTMPDYVSNAIEGKDSVTNTEEDEVVTLYEVHAYLSLDEDPLTNGKSAPYIITISESTNTVLSIYRNWEIDDHCMKRLDWFVQFNYITWRGVYGIGFAEVLDGVAAATTGSLRALLDSATIANFPTLLTTKGAKMVGQNTNVQPGQVTQIEGTNGVTGRLSDQIMPLQLGQPQPILMQLMDYLDNKVRQFYNTTSASLENVGDETPVGTTLALIEEGSKRYAAINARLHDANRKVLKIACRIFKHNLDEECIIDELGELIINRNDFEYDDIEVVTDPHIFSEAQRFALNQAVFQLGNNNPLYNQVELHRRMLESMHVADIDRLFAIPQQAGKLNAVAENIASLAGTPLQAFNEQNHIAHLKTHFGFALDPIFGSNPMNIPKMMGLLSHMQDHISMLYGQVFNHALIEVGADKYDIIENESTAKIDEELEQLNGVVLQNVQKILQPFMEQYAKFAQMVQQANQPPQDPNMLKAQVDQMRAQNEQQKMQLDAQTEQQKMQIEQAKMQLEQQKMQFEAQDSQLDAQTKQQESQVEDNYNNTLLSIEQMKANTEENKYLLQAQIELEKLRAQQGMAIREENLEREIHNAKTQFEHDNAVADRQIELFKMEHQAAKEEKKEIQKTRSKKSKQSNEES